MEPTTIIVGANTLFVLGLAFKLGQYSSRVEELEKKVAGVEDSKLDVAIATLAGKVDGMQEKLHTLSDYLMMPGVRKATASGD